MTQPSVDGGEAQDAHPEDIWTALPTSAEYAAMRRRLRQAEIDRDHWKANHDEQVRQKRALRADLLHEVSEALETQMCGDCGFELNDRTWSGCIVCGPIHDLLLNEPHEAAALGLVEGETR